MTSLSNIFDVTVFFFSSIVTGPSFMSISLLVLELRQFLFVRDWPEFQKSETPTFEFCPTSEIGAREGYQTWHDVTAFTVAAFAVSELLRENQQGGGVKIPPPRLGLKSNRTFDN